jgi:hypothetical protein
MIERERETKKKKKSNGWYTLKMNEYTHIIHIYIWYNNNNNK